MRSRSIAFVLALSLGSSAFAEVAPDFSQLLRWRNVGPYRGGRTRAISGVPSQPNVFYMAPVNGGVFKSTDYGRTWQPLFDDQPTASVGALAVSVSNPDIIYVGSGEGLHRPDLSLGDGVYKSIDAGKTWTHLGLPSGQQVAQLAVDPQNPDHILVAVAGHPYGPNEERGIFLSTNGGRNFARTLFKNENIGGADVQIDPTNPQIVYASLWEARDGPWENAAWNGSDAGIFKSLDGGQTWQRLGGGLPNDIVQANLAIAASAPQTLLAAVATLHAVKIYRSDDGGKNWKIATDDKRPAERIGGGDLPVLRIDPHNPLIVYSASIVCWKSTDGGKTWDGWRGAPGGDDYQNVWISPNDSNVVMLGSDQGAIITVNGGATWSSWYNQSTAQLYHVSADNAFPYHLYSGQQESGSVGIASRGPNGEITFRDWHPVAAEEYGYVTPDPRDWQIVYGGKLTRFDQRTHEAQEVMPKAFRSDDFRVVRTEPIVFSPFDPHMLFFAANSLWATHDEGRDWRQVSPDLTRKTYEVPKSVGIFRNRPTAQPRQRGVIYAVAPSPLDKNRIWAGTDDGLIRLTTNDGKNWSDVTPPQIGPWWKISLIDASHFDKATAYAAVNTIRLDDLRPHIFRTNDSGKTWREIVNGIPANENVNAVREDPQRRGMLFSGTERGVYVSFDDGENWQSLRLNLPATSMRDLIVKDDDLVVATHGRGFWILDNITPLRQFQPNEKQTGLFKPQTALRIRWDTNTDTPLPPDEPAGENPPQGAMLDYSLGAETSGTVALEIRDAAGHLVRRFASHDPIPPADPELKIPSYWLQPPRVLSAAPGLHRFFWDMHGAPLPKAEANYPMAAVAHETEPQPSAPWVLPGDYSVSLTSGGKTFSQPLKIKMDPRIKVSMADLTTQFQLSSELYELRGALEPLGKSYDAVASALEKRKAEMSANGLGNEAQSLRKKLEQLADPVAMRNGQPLAFDVLNKVGRLFDQIQGVDASPTSQQQTAAAELERAAPTGRELWKSVETDVAALNEKLQKAGLKPIELR